MSLLTFVFAPLLTAGTPPPPVLECADLVPILGMLERGHYARDQVGGSVAEKRSIEQFTQLIDRSKNLLLEQDVDKLRTELPKLFPAMRKGDCSVLAAASELIIQRTREDEQIARELLGPKYALDESVEVHLDNEKRGHAKSPSERASRVKSLVHFQISNFLIAGLDLEAAKKKVIHRYELATKRTEERRSKEELPSIYAEAYATSLDPHSSFLSAEMLADFQINMRLSLEGIGAVLRSEDGFTVIQELVPGGQADIQNILRPKDKITAVRQEGEEPVDVIDMDLRDVVGMIRGKKGTKVTLTILREGKETTTLDVTIVRDKVDVKEQAAKITYETQKIGKRDLKIGIIELPSFYGGDSEGRSSYKDMRRLLGEARENNVDALVLDLSRNGGGLLEDAVRISGLFLKTGGIVATKSSEGDVEVLEDEDPAVVFNKPLVILTSPVSASASEILAGALKDYRRAVIVGGGVQTFGKGTVQKLQPLPRGLGALKITTGMFFVPSGQSTQQIGVTSDIVVPSIFASYDTGEKALDYSLTPQSTKPFVAGSGNSHAGDERWSPITPTVVSKLTARSEGRVKSDAMMKEIEKEVTEAKKDRATVKLADLRKEAAEAKKKAGEAKTDEKAEKEESAFDRYQKAFVMEGVRIAADLIEALGA